MPVDVSQKNSQLLLVLFVAKLFLFKPTHTLMTNYIIPIAIAPSAYEKVWLRGIYNLQISSPAARLPIHTRVVASIFSSPLEQPRGCREGIDRHSFILVENAVVLSTPSYIVLSRSKFHTPSILLLHADLLLVLPPPFLPPLAQPFPHLSHLRPRPTRPQYVLQLPQRVLPIFHLRPVLLRRHRHVPLAVNPVALVRPQSIAHLRRDPIGAGDVEPQLHLRLHLVYVLSARPG
mmetsp:Transcript_14837/g.32356  ORF Transcript_14837/g.32356 Transcript_14837/m.32356 type:complete len:233 (-) Transcript_14837:408-1106(-)